MKGLCGYRRLVAKTDYTRQWLGNGFRKGRARGRQEGRAWGECLRVKESLEDEDGSDLVNDCAVLGARAPSGMKVAMGLGGGEAFVPQVEGELSLLMHQAGKVLGLDGLGTQVAGHVERIADDDGAAVMATGEAREGAEVLASAGANEGEHGLCGEAESIGDGYTDAAIAHVQTHEAVGRGLPREYKGFGWRWIGRVCLMHGAMVRRQRLGRAR